MEIPDTPPPDHHANDSANSFRNPWPPKSLLASHQVFSQFPIALAKRIEGYHIKDVKVISPDFARDAPDEGVIKATWLGHAPVRILFDPIWSERASPNQYAGPRRRLPPPCELEDLPDFQFVVTSHNQLTAENTSDTGYMTQDGPCPAFKGTLCVIFKFSDFESDFVSPEIGERYGPLDLALLSIWRGSSLSFLSTFGLRLATTELLDGLHASPAHAVRLFRDIRARRGIAMHFATFAGSSEEAREAVAELVAACERDGIPSRVDEEGGFGVADVGQTVVVEVKGNVEEAEETETTG
ncbi:hypothetical protein EIP86_004402 [Pleurotus ostreatoroseus]|nr:hypothetical protein EIP86_004402 [Pleurotus ostreatoroseus]